MSSHIARIVSKQLAQPPKWLVTNLVYECVVGSQAYGVSTDESDFDVYGICIPRKEDVFPHLKGEIEGFGRQKQRFDQWQQHHIFDKDALAGHGRNYDFSVYNIVKYFSLCMQNNPNIVDSLFVPLTCILFSTQVGQHIRENRKLFLNKNSYHTFKGYAYAQLHKIDTSKIEKDNPVLLFEQEFEIPHQTKLSDIECENLHEGIESLKNLTDQQLLQYRSLYKSELHKSKRFEMIKVNTYDIKFAYHILRLLDEAEQILTLGDLDLQRSREMMKSIRRGEWTEQQIREYFQSKEVSLEKLYLESKLPHSPDESSIKSLLFECLEMHYGSLADCIKLTNLDLQKTLDEIDERIAILRKNLI